MFRSRLISWVEHTGKRYITKLVLYFSGKDSIFHIKVVVDMGGHFTDPRMLENIRYMRPFVRLELEYGAYQWFYLVWEVMAKVIASPEHGFLNFICSFAFKRRIAMKHLVEQYSQGPNINSVVISRLEQHFWSHILISPTKGTSFIFDILHAPSKIAYLNILIRI